MSFDRGDQPTTKALFDAWRKDHGPGYVEYGDWFIFEDGARLNKLCPASFPEDEQMRRRYIRLRAEQAEREFESYKQHLIEEAKYAKKSGLELSFDLEDEKERLAELKKVAEECRQAYLDDTAEERKRQESLNQTLAFEAAERSKNSADANAVLTELRKL
ncbi:hypothetical protein [Thalassoroseus pseudoceratinae]|uniref:hypothetical protein n=1 Tax=Thalassoroseus pseudoceratinae TaxID=2713176 RepID=UPI00141FA7F3|nr:hypothetical protein [Thalassoroseus pseudoceratinae]